MKNGSSFQVYIMWLIGILEGLQDDFRRVLEKRYNLSKYILSCCSTADITKEHFEKIDVKYLCFHFEIDGQEYYDDLGESMALSEFYGRMEKGAMTKTSQPNAQEYKDFFSKYLAFDQFGDDEEVLKKLEQSLEVEKMPIYPDSGSIKKIGDVIVIKIG